MKTYIFGLMLSVALFCPRQSLADSEFAGGFSPINNESFRARFFLKGELFVVDGSGKKLLAPTTDLREWRAGMKSNKIDAFWKTKAKGIRDIALHFVCEIHDDNSLTLTLKQYDSIENSHSNSKKANFGKLLREQTVELENFEPVSWVAESNESQRVILRFTPSLESVRENMTLDKLTIGGDRGSFLVTDNQGYLWGENVRFGGVLSGMRSHRGAFVISYYPFKGAKELGFATGKMIELNLTDSLKVKIRNDSDLIPGEMRAKVYGKYIPSIKSESVNSVYSFGQDRVDFVPKEFGL